MQLTRRSFFRKARHGERGAVMTVFAVMVAGGVAFGMLALSVDVGNIMYERRQLQNGADSTSLALARECANSLLSDDCAPDNPEVEELLDLNANDDTAQYDTRADALFGACGRATTVVTLPLPECASEATDAPFEDLTECPPLPDWLRGTGVEIPYVETYSRTESLESDTTLLPKYFSQLIKGGGSDASVTACARAAWGAPGSYTGTVPLTFSTCEWQEQTSNGLNYVTEQPSGPKPGYGPGATPWPDASREIVIQLHSPTGSDACAWNGKDTAGGFGWVDGSNCEATVTTNGWARIDTGNNTPQDCKAVLDGLVGTTVSLPVFDCLVGSQTEPTSVPADCDPAQRDTQGSNTWYHIAGWAKFYLTGYKLTGDTKPSIAPGGAAGCGNNGGDRCIFGWFLKGALDDNGGTIAPPGSGNDFGTYLIRPAG